MKTISKESKHWIQNFTKNRTVVFDERYYQENNYKHSKTYWKFELLVPYKNDFIKVFLVIEACGTTESAFKEKRDHKDYYYLAHICIPELDISEYNYGFSNYTGQLKYILEALKKDLANLDSIPKYGCYNNMSIPKKFKN